MTDSKRDARLGQLGVRCRSGAAEILFDEVRVLRGSRRVANGRGVVGIGACHRGECRFLCQCSSCSPCGVGASRIPIAASVPASTWRDVCPRPLSRRAASLAGCSSSWAKLSPATRSVPSVTGYRWSVAPRRIQSGRRSFRGGRVQVYGCSPGCLVWSIALSVGLTILGNLLIRLF
jgi:hypothetical protein